MAKQTDNPANKWSEQRQKQREMGDEIERRKEGECLNSLYR
jgi:hypothetical protein